MKKEIRVDITIIGSGPAGYYAAMQAAKAGKSVAMVEKMDQPGGVCLFSGTIPSKTLREAIIDLTGFYINEFSQDDLLKKLSLKSLQNRLEEVIQHEEKNIQRKIRKNKITLIRGIGSFIDNEKLQVLDENGTLHTEILSKTFIIATGSTPRHPIDIPFDSRVILDSTQLLQMETIPESLIVLGGGVIGAEYASYFSIMGTKVTVIDKKERILPLIDEEIGLHLQYALADLGLKFYSNKIPEKIERNRNSATVRFTDGTSLSASALFCALGRVALVDGLGLENIGVHLNERGFIPVNAMFQTAVPNVYAVGDVIGHPALASTAMEQGRIASRYACGLKNYFTSPFHPIGIYTIPEISSYGYSENQLKKMGCKYEVGRAYYYEIARSHIARDETGMFKILFHPDTLAILGIHIIGKRATEVIHIGQVAISFRAPLNYFVEHIFNYPTYAEGYRIAAFNGLNKIRISCSEYITTP